MSHLYTDEELANLRKLPKSVKNPGARWAQKPKGQPSHKQRNFKAECTTEDGQVHRFQIYQRENLSDPLDFSCGIVYQPPGGQQLTLARFNGPSHQHGDIHYQTHIHTATAAAIAAGRKPEHIAKVTKDYRTLEGALARLLHDFNMSGKLADPDQPTLFDDHYS